ncbi:alpha-hydroxy-acid oxidizing protein [Desulfovibrio sp. OttesenSCG-928-C14]|nr:alpha-hydroxy-acid oxidizing protein [Desulfovibrio sp. OttesenSCG-928-C14]
MKEIRDKARERVKKRCRVCPVCDGRACAGEVPGMGGIGTGAAFQNNVRALAALQVNMRVLHGANEPCACTEFFGLKLALPVMAAPVGSVALNLGSDMSDTDYTRIMAAGCKAAGTLGSVGDMPDLGVMEQHLKAFGDYVDYCIPFIKPWDVDAIKSRIDLIARFGCKIAGSDVDGAGLPTLRMLSAPVGTRPACDIAAVTSYAHEKGLKFIIKGVMTVDEAILCAEAGVDAIVVSNHGGRVLDCTPGTADVLPEIADAVGGRMVVMMDGGLRSGLDVLKAMALGAKMTLICRPVTIAVHGDENEGLAKYFAMIKDQFTQAMRMTGCPDVNSITRRVLY